MSITRCAGSLACFALVAASLRAQGVGAGGPGHLTGRVVDSRSQSVAAADVRLGQRRTTSDSAGAFDLDSVGVGDYVLTVRKLGFLMDSRTIHVGTEGAIVRVVLTRVASLPAVVTVASPGGLRGVISDTASHAVVGAQVEVLGSGHSSSDSGGRFFVALKAGHYMVRIRKPGYRPQLASVTVPRDSGRHLAVWLEVDSANALVRENVALFDLDRRLARRNPVRSQVYTREDLAQIGSTELGDVAARAVGGSPISSGPCFVYLDGGPQKMPIWALEKSDVEFFEVYTASTGRTRTRDREADMPKAACGRLTMIAWLHK